MKSFSASRQRIMRVLRSSVFGHIFSSSSMAFTEVRSLPRSPSSSDNPRARVTSATRLNWVATPAAACSNPSISAAWAAASGEDLIAAKASVTVR